MLKLNRDGQWVTAYITGIDPLESTEPGTIYYKVCAQWHDPNNAYEMFKFENIFPMEDDTTRINQALSQPLTTVTVLFVYHDPTIYWMARPW